MSIREQEIWQACDDLLAMGKSPREITGEAIGNRLRELKFKAGSLTYRYRYRDSWMAKRGLTRENLEEIPKPSDIIERSAAIFRQSIENSVREEYELRTHEAQSRTIEANLKYDILLKSFEDIYQLNNELKNQIQEFQHEITTLKEQLKKETDKNLQSENQIHLAKESTAQQRLMFERLIQDQKQVFEETLKHYSNEIEELKVQMASKEGRWIKEKEYVARLQERLNIVLIELAQIKSNDISNNSVIA